MKANIDRLGHVEQYHWSMRITKCLRTFQMVDKLQQAQRLLLECQSEELNHSGRATLLVTH
eukprot:10635306-Prorocentrum_lima.AAC.1